MHKICLTQAVVYGLSRTKIEDIMQIFFPSYKSFINGTCKSTFLEKYPSCHNTRMNAYLFLHLQLQDQIVSSFERFGFSNLVNWANLNGIHYYPDKGS